VGVAGKLGFFFCWGVCFWFFVGLWGGWLFFVFLVLVFLWVVAFFFLQFWVCFWFVCVVCLMCVFSGVVFGVVFLRFFLFFGAGWPVFCF